MLACSRLPTRFTEPLTLSTSLENSQLFGRFKSAGGSPAGFHKHRLVVSEQRSGRPLQRGSARCSQLLRSGCADPFVRLTPWRPSGSHEREDGRRARSGGKSGRDLACGQAEVPDCSLDSGRDAIANVRRASARQRKHAGTTSGLYVIEDVRRGLRMTAMGRLRPLWVESRH